MDMWKQCPVVEIIGPAGAGKTTLFRALEKSIPGIQCEFLPPVWNPSYFLFFTKNILSLPSTLMRIPGKEDRLLTRRELAWMAIINGWPEILEKRTCQKAILLDQGPIFLIAALSGFGPQYIFQKKMQNWWEETYQRWAQTIDWVIWLDASDEILKERIRGRESSHIIKDESDQEVYAFLEKYRATYTSIVGQIQTYNSELHVTRFNTGQVCVEEIIRNVISEIDVGENWVN